MNSAGDENVIDDNYSKGIDRVLLKFSTLLVQATYLTKSDSSVSTVILMRNKLPNSLDTTSLTVKAFRSLQRTTLAMRMQNQNRS